MPHPLAIAAALYGGYQGYKGAKRSGASGLGRLFGAAAGAYGGYNLAGMIPGVSTSAPAVLANSAGTGTIAANSPFAAAGNSSLVGVGAATETAKQFGLEELKQMMLMNKKGEFSPYKISGLIGAGSYLSGAFDPQPTDIYTPGYNMGYLDLKNERPGYTYIDPDTGQEKAYEKIYSPEEGGLGDPRMGPYQMNVRRLRTGGIASIKKFNEGGVNYLPSKVSHDENDANNYVRASGYVADGEGVGDKDEDTMLAQLADGEFVTRADGVLGAGIIAGANPNSMKDMREKGAEYFYEQQKRYKRVFDLLKDRNGNSEQKTN
jgi:hypothetical protein